MKFPSVKYLGEQALIPLKRFYLPLFFSFMGTVVAICLINADEMIATPPELISLMYTCLLALPCSLGFMLYAERARRNVRIETSVLAVGLIAIYKFWLSPHTGSWHYNTRHFIIFLVLAAVVHMWVAIAPYIKKDERLGFWRYNETLFARMLLSLAFSAALFLGLSLGIEACIVLFKFDFDYYKVYLRLWVVVMGVFNTWFFLAGIPASYEEINTEKAFPNALRIFTQYILIPIVTVYMVILYAYGVKILLTWSLPKGWVSTLIFCYAVVGILAVLLVTPLRDDKDNAWVRFFSRFFFRASLPLIVLLYVAIWVRVGSYGITEWRYFLVLMGAWLGFISFYFIRSRAKNIKVIPVSLIIIGLLSVFGPWSAFPVAERSQVKRFKHLLIKNNIRRPGQKVTQGTGRVSMQDGLELNSMLAYFIEHKEVPALQDIYAANLEKLVKETQSDKSRWADDEMLKEKLFGILLNDSVNAARLLADRYNSFDFDVNKGLEVAGFSKTFHFSFGTYSRTDNYRIWLSDTDSLRVVLDNKDTHSSVDFLRKGNVVEIIQLDSLIKRLQAISGSDSSGLPQKVMTIDDTGSLKLRLIIKSINIKDTANTSEGPKVRSLNAYILVR